MKKIGIFLGVLFMGLLIFVRSPAPAHADAWVLPFSKIPDIIEMAQTLFSGGKLEFSSIISTGTSLDDIISMWQDFKDNLAHAQTQKRSDATFSGMLDLTKQGLSVIESGSDFVIPFTYDDVNAFTLYNPYWYLRNMTTNPDNVVTNPDPSFISYINLINGASGTGLDFFWKNTNTFALDGSGSVSVTIPSSSLSYFINNPGSYNIINGVNKTNTMFYSPIQDIYITLENGLYKINQTIQCFYNIPLPSNYGTDRFVASFNIRNGNLNVMSSSVAGIYNYSLSYSNSLLSNVFQWLSNKCRNVNIYVDGELWAWAGEIVLPPVGAPDVIQVGDTGQDTYDVYGLELPDDLGLDIPDFIDWILTKLKEGATTISLEDAIADEVPLVRTVDGDRAITYSDTRPIWEVIERDIDVPSDDPDPNPTPTPDPGDPPILKLPTLNYLPHNHDSTVLSELIDATQNTIPEELMNLIWNCFGLLVIGGLIFILHK